MDEPLIFVTPATPTKEKNKPVIINKNNLQVPKPIYAHKVMIGGKMVVVKKITKNPRRRNLTIIDIIKIIKHIV